MKVWVRLVFGCLLSWSGLALPAAAQAPLPVPGKKEADKPKDTAPPKKVPASEGRIANADRISKLQAFLQKDQDLRVKIAGAGERLVEEVRKISKEIGALEERLTEKNNVLEKLGKETKGEEAERLRGEIKDLEIQRDLAREQLDLTIKERKLIQDRLGGLDQKILQNQAMLDLLMAGGGAGPGKTDTEEQDPRLKSAREAARLKEESAKDAEEESKSLEQRIQSLERFLELNRTIVGTEKKKLQINEQQVKVLEQEVEKMTKAGAPGEEVDGLKRKLAEAVVRVDELRLGMQTRSERMGRLQTELTSLRKEQAILEQEAAARQAEAVKARAEVDELENPLTSRNIWNWSIRHGPKIFIILLAMFGLRFLVRSMDHRLVQFMAERGDGGNKQERENRARTLVSVFHNFAMVAVLGGGGLMLLEEIGIPVVPLMGGAAILGLAVAFGAQNLIKDYFYGFVILLENQYVVNDVVKVGGISGQVERITLRMTVLRDQEGIVHFIPHGQITSVSNLTQGWSRAKFDIGVSYRENVDQVMEILLQVGRELRRDPLFSDLILDEPEMLGVDALSDSAVVLRLLIKTRPLQQWKVKREMLRRIKKAFDSAGIEIPLPHRVVYHRNEGESKQGQRFAA